MNFIDDIKLRVKNNPKKTIILTESNDERVLKAIEYILKENLANIILLGRLNSTNYDLRNIKIVIPEESSLLEKFTFELFNLRKDKGLTIEKSKELLTTNYMYFACMLLKFNLADGVVSGAIHTTASTIKPALEILDKKSMLASSFFLMDIPSFNDIYLFSDSALNINPSSEELACISIDSSNNYKKIINKDSITALLSYSSYSSAKGETVNKVKEALKKVKKINSDIIIDGEMQLDAAIVPEVAAIKTPNSSVSGRANVLIFPDLISGNIGYKLVHRFAKAKAYGPFIQGLSKPVSDLSRGTNSDEIIGTILITCLMAV